MQKESTMTQKKLSKGFTLVELLVVVAIIAILSTIGLTVFTSAQANARDARRKSDIDAIAKVLETQRAPGTVYYLSLPSAGFSGGAVPVDNAGVAGKPNYCIRTSTAVTAPADGIPWTVTATCPTGPAVVAGESAWTAIPSTGLAVGTGTAPFVTSTISWKVCTRLETGTIHCKASAQ